ncbi:unnamed protein product [Rotaria sp. Silwood1]|nr:unnamed protein product [Rotaria sp. Silwood1]CAF1618040.1 unnamed protein product [Rotaria sp. Silwood1]
MGFGTSIRIVVMEPDIIAHVLAHSNAQDFIRTSDNGVSLKHLIGERNLVMTNGSYHDRARQMLNPAFHFDNVKSMISTMNNQTARIIDELFVLSNGKNFIDLQNEFQRLTLTILVSTVFGTNFETTVNVKEIASKGFTEVLDAVQYRVLHLIDHIPFISRLPFLCKPSLDSGCRKVSEILTQVINDRRQGRSTAQCSNADLLDLLLFAVDKEGKPFGEQEIKDLTLSFTFSGHETTANLMTWTMYVLMTNKDVWHACREEVDRILLDDTEPTYEHLSKLVVCEAVLQETLRLYPSAPFFSRQCVREHTVTTSQRQLRIPAGTTIILNTYALHRDADLWSRSLEFDYTRWMRHPITGIKPKLAHPYCYLPFGAGPRNCIAQNFALVEAKIILAMLVQRCDFEMEPAFHSRSNRRVQVNYPNIWSFIKFLQGEANRFHLMYVQFIAGFGVRSKQAKTIAI